MAHQTGWIDENKRIWFADYIGDITPEDIAGAGEAGCNVADEGAVYALIDFTDANSWPKNLIGIAGKTDKLMQFSKHPNAIWFAFSGANTVIRFGIQVFMRSKVKVFETREEAVTFLNEMAETAATP